MFSAFLYILAMALTIPGLPRVVNEMMTGSKAVCFFTGSGRSSRTEFLSLTECDLQQSMVLPCHC